MNFCDQKVLLTGVNVSILGALGHSSNSSQVALVTKWSEFGHRLFFDKIKITSVI
jgi:hypothetical protein